MADTMFSIDLGDMADSARQHLASGAYGSMDEVVREAIRALDREADAFDEWQQQPAFEEMLRREVRGTLEDPRPPIPVEEAFAELDRRIAARRARKVRDEAA